MVLRASESYKQMEGQSKKLIWLLNVPVCIRDWSKAKLCKLKHTRGFSTGCEKVVLNINLL